MLQNKKLLCIVFIMYGALFEDMSVTTVCLKAHCIPRIIWSYWDGCIVPDDVKEMLALTKQSLVNFTYSLITPRNITYFFDVSSFPQGFDNLNVVGQSDYIRICLLEKYGGIYVDSTTYVNSGFEMDWFYSETVKSKKDFFGFEFEFDRRVAFQIRTSFCGSSVGGVVVKSYKNEFDIALREDIQKYMEKNCAELLSRHLIVEHLCHIHHVSHMVLGKIIDNDKSLLEKILILPINRSHVRLSAECKWNKKCIKNRVLNDPAVRSYPFVKLSSGARVGKRLGWEKKRWGKKKDLL